MEGIEQTSGSLQQVQNNNFVSPLVIHRCIMEAVLVAYCVVVINHNPSLGWGNPIPNQFALPPHSVQRRSKEPATFSGEVSEDADTRTSIVFSYFACMQWTPQHKEVAYAATLLRDDWWTAYLHRRSEKILLDWTSLPLALLDRFGNKQRTKEALPNTVDLSRGCKSVWEYVAEVEVTLVGSIPQMKPLYCNSLFGDCIETLWGGCLSRTQVLIRGNSRG